MTIKITTLWRHCLTISVIRTRNNLTVPNVFCFHIHFVMDA